jgi:hypothetical protein
LESGQGNLIKSIARNMSEEKSAEDLEPPDETHRLDKEKIYRRLQEVGPC